MTVFPARDLSGNAHAVRHGGLVGGLRQLEQFLDLDLDLGFDLLCVFIRQGTMPQGVGRDLGAIQADGAELAKRVLAGDLQNLHEGGLECVAKATGEKASHISWLCRAYIFSRYK